MEDRPPASRANGKESSVAAGEPLALLGKAHLRYLDLIPRESFEEKIAHLVLEGKGPWGEVGRLFDRVLEAIHGFPTEGIRTVLFGGGTGLSSVLGGDTALPGWSTSPFVGLKRCFHDLTVAVCVTDDGGSSGALLKEIPCIAVGDLRRAILSSIMPHHLLARYPSLDPEALETVAACLQRILNHRFGAHPSRAVVRQPSCLLDAKARRSVPKPLLAFLDRTGRAFHDHPALKGIQLEGHCLGNLLLVGSIVSQQGGAGARSATRHPGTAPLGHREILEGIHGFAESIGAGRGTIFPACTTQGELHVLYQHGVVSAGEDKCARGHSAFPVQRVWVHFAGRPRPDPRLVRRIREADLIVFAPGSLYTSILPILQVPAIVEAVKKNKKALKILGANFWVQRGETDLSLRRGGKEYYVSDLIEAYHHNVRGGVADLFEFVIVTDLQSIPGDILRNYALEGKVPIYLDKERVRRMGFQPVEAAVFSERKLRNERVIQHDPEKFALVVKTLCYLHLHGRRTHRAIALPDPLPVPAPRFPRKGYLCEHWRRVRHRVAQMDIREGRLRETLLRILWENREILAEHLSYARGIRKIPERAWARSKEWDNILGYYDPEDGYIKIHEDLVGAGHDRLSEDLLIALGESLLGNYAMSKTIREVKEGGELLGKILEIELRPTRDRRTFLRDPELRQYLRLAQMRPSRKAPQRFRMVINDNEAFTPPGLLFGLLYAWYLNNRLGGIVDYEMSLLRWNISELIPKPSMARARMQEQVDFFRRVVFRQRIPSP